MQPIGLAAGDTSQAWYAVPIMHTNDSATLPSAPSRFAHVMDPAAVSASPFSSCCAYVPESTENNVAYSGSLGQFGCSTSNNVQGDMLNMFGKPAATQPDAALAPAAVDSMDCSGEVDPQSSSIAYALQLLGGRSSSSCSTQMAWDDEDPLEDNILPAVSAALNSADPAAAPNPCSTPPRRTATQVCPTAPARRGHTLKLVPAAELGLFLGSA